jgi:hypothetical protein
MDKINVEGHSNLKRDMSSGAILNTDYSEYEKYLMIRAQKESDRVKLDTAMNEISVLKSELTEIKNLLLNLGKQNGSI